MTMGGSLLFAIKKAARLLAIAAIVLVLAGLVYERVGEWRDHRRFPQVGRSVDIGGRTLNIYSSGQGGPTVVLDSGHGMAGYNWAFIQREIAKSTSACWYDRAGNGWSDPGPDPNWSDSAARDLHELLKAAGLAPPYVLVGHSMSAFNVRMYYSLYPDEVAGMVLVDPIPEYTDIRNPTMPRSRPRFPRGFGLALATTAGRLGLIRLLSSAPGPPPKGLSEVEWATISNLENRWRAKVAGIQEGPALPNAQLVRAAGCLGNIPLIVLTAGLADSWEPPEAHRINIELQAEMAGLSTRGRQVIVKESRHYIPYEAPDAVIGAVQDVVGAVRQDVPSLELRKAASPRVEASALPSSERGAKP